MRAVDASTPCHGAICECLALASTSTAARVQVREGRTIVTDGPFAETREQTAGYFLVETRDLQDAVSIAAGIPGARIGTVEVRLVREIEGLPEV
ncbi:MAG: hypothetical protein KIT40_02915 [Nitrospira sp.]|nr:hypothetical protein [Nitrospira sp.]